MDSWQPRQSHSRKVRFVMPWMRTHGPHIMQGSFAGPQGNLSFQPWKMRNRLGTLTQARDWMAITCVVGFAFPPWKIKIFSLENSRWILAVSRLKTSKQTKFQRKICTFWVCREGSRRGESSTGIPGRVSGLSFEVVLASHVSILCLSVSSEALQPRATCVCRCPHGRELLISSAACFQDLNSSSLSSTWARLSLLAASCENSSLEIKWFISHVFVWFSPVFHLNASLRSVAFSNISSQEKFYHHLEVAQDCFVE